MLQKWDKQNYYNFLRQIGANKNIRYRLLEAILLRFGRIRGNRDTKCTLFLDSSLYKEALFRYLCSHISNIRERELQHSLDFIKAEIYVAIPFCIPITSHRARF